MTRIVSISDQGPRDEFPVVIATTPYTARERQIAICAVILLCASVPIALPIADRQLPRIDAFLPIVQSIVFLAEAVTALLIFAQYYVSRQRALLAIAGAYLASGLFAFLQTLTFPGAYVPFALIGDGVNTPAWYFGLWHLSLPTGAIIYALSRDKRTAPGDSVLVDIALTVLFVILLVVGLSWIILSGILPRAYDPELRTLTPEIKFVAVAIFALNLTALLLLAKNLRTKLELWFLVAVFATLPSMLFVIVITNPRYPVAWYMVRLYFLFTSITVLTALIIETTVLYARLAGALNLAREERANRFISLDAAIGAMAHEIRQPLTAIANTSAAGRNWLERSPPNLVEAKDSFNAIVRQSYRIEETLKGVRRLFQSAGDQGGERVYIEDIALQALNVLKQDLMTSRVAAATDFAAARSPIEGDQTQLQQVLLNLIKNAIDAMQGVQPADRKLSVVTRMEEDSAVLRIGDSGQGVAEDLRRKIFDPFFTTKPSGMGLGLSICRQIIEAHGGTLALETGDRPGTTFIVTLPIAKPFAPDKPVQ